MTNEAWPASFSLPAFLSRSRALSPAAETHLGAAGRAPPGPLLPAGEGTRGFPEALLPQGSLRLPFPGLDLKGGVLAGSEPLEIPREKGSSFRVSREEWPQPAPQSAVSLLVGLSPGRRCGEDMIVYGFA